MEIRNSTIKDLDEILSIYDHARQYMIENGNPNQWGLDRPSKQQIIKDIENENSYVCLDEDEIVGVFYFNIDEDKTYNEIDGEWINEMTYGVVHRIAVKNNKKGIGSFCINWAYINCLNLRIDTHEDNKAMKSLLEKMNFKYCGIIKLENGDPRMAYQLV